MILIISYRFHFLLPPPFFFLLLSHFLRIFQPVSPFSPFAGLSKAAKGPTNEMYKLDMTDKSNYKWSKLPEGKMCPLPRWFHTATYDENGTLMVFGGYSADFRCELNDKSHHGGLF